MLNRKRILVVEDSAPDAELITLTLGNVTFPFEVEWVNTEADFRKQVATQPPDIILTDYRIASFDALCVLDVVRHQIPDCPVIVITGTLTDELAAECIKQGATDYLLKDKLERLPSAVERALAAKELMSERTQVREELQASEERYRLLFDTNPLPMWVYDRESHQFLAVNNAAIDNYGYSRDEFFRMKVTDLWLAEEVPATLLSLADSGNDPRLRPRTHCRRDGSLVHAEVTAMNMLFNGRAARLVIAADVTERKEAQQILHHYGAIVSASDDAIIGLSVDGTVVSWNVGAESLYGYSEGEVLGKHMAMVVDPEQRSAQINTVLQGGASIRNLETVHLRKNQARVNVALTVSPIRDSEGEITGGSVISRDISEKKQLEQQFLQAQKMEAVGRLAGGVAHDFNNILTVITGYADFALASLNPGDPIFDSLEIIQGAATRAAGLTRQLLAFSRKQVLQPKIVDLNDLIRGESGMLSRLIGENIELVTNFGTDLWAVKIDPGQLEQVVLNLAINAQDAMPTGGRLVLETRRLSEPRGTLMVVQDTGTGMDAETLRQVFEPFFTTKEPGKGTGLGLATVYGIVQQSGGTISVESKPGHGTTFRIWFPAAESQPVSIAAETPGQSPFAGTETILLVEDDEALRLLTALLLRERGYAVVEASNTQEACDALTRPHQRIDLLLTDLIMPSGGAPEMSHVLQSGREGIPVLYMSGYADDLLVRYGISGSDINFLEKPFTSVALGHKVRQALEKRLVIRRQSGASSIM